MSLSISVTRSARLCCLAFSALLITGCFELPEPYTERNPTTNGDNNGLPLGSGTGSPTYLDNLWNDISVLGTTSFASSESPTMHASKVQVADNGNVFVSWTALSNFDASTGTYGNQSVTIRRAVPQTDGSLQWNPENQQQNYVPVGLTATATDFDFVANKTNGDGYAAWRAGGEIHISEFMGSMGHFMGSTQLDDGHAPHIVVAPDGSPYLVAQEHATGGFALNLHKRTGFGNWGSAVPLHRTDTNSAFSMSHDMLKVGVDGLGNIVAVWLEEQANVSVLRMARFDTATMTWGPAEVVLDSSNTLSLDLGTLKSFALSSEESSDNLNIILYFDAGDAKSIYSIAYLATEGWQTPTRLDQQTTKTIASTPVVATNPTGNIVVAWVEADSPAAAADDGHSGHTHSGSDGGATGNMQALVSVEYTPANQWQDIAQIGQMAMGVTVTQLQLSMNSAGATSAGWIEKDSAGSRVVISHKKPELAWSQPELIRSYDASIATAHAVGVTLDSANMPSVVMAVEQAIESDTGFTIQLGIRADDIEAVQPDASDPGTNDPGTNDPGTNDPGTNDPGTNDPGTNDPGTNDPGTNDPGTNDPGTNDPGTNDPGTNDPGTNDPGTNDPEPGTVEGAWNSPADLTMESLATTSEPSTNSLKLQLGANDKIFASWNIRSRDQSNNDLERTTLRMSTIDSSGNMAWTDPDMADLIKEPTVVTDHSQYVFNKASGDGYVLWVNGEQISATEYMGSMNHIMNAPTVVAEGHAPKVLVDANGAAYLVTQAHMTGGFGLSVYKRTATNTWTTDSNTDLLHRMAPAESTSYSMPNHFFTAILDGNDDILAVWLEERDGAYSLWSARYMTQMSMWQSAQEIQADTNGLSLNKLVSMTANAVPGSDDAHVVLFQDNGTNKAIFTAEYASSATTPGWQEFVRRDVQSNTLSIESAPTFAHNKNGETLIGWIETDSSSGMGMDRVAALHYSPGHGGWHEILPIADMAHMVQASGLRLSLNDAGNASALWVESDSNASRVVASHALAHQSWSQVELIRSIASNQGVILDNALVLNENDIPVALGVLRISNGTNDMFHTWYNVRATDISVVPDNTTPGTTDPTPTDPGNQDPGNGGNLPETVNWSTPYNAVELMHEANANVRFHGPQVVMDDWGNSVVHMSIITQGSAGNSASATSIDNKVYRSTGENVWQEIMSTALFSDLSPNALMDYIKVVSSTGNLYSLIRDNGKLYLARYLANVGWSKLEIPGVSADIAQQNMQLLTDDTGMVTLTWHQPSAVCCTVDINAKHFMVSSGWLPTETLSVATQAVLSPHYIDETGKVHAAWLVENTAPEVGGFAVKMATYQPMVGWSAATDGPAGIRSALVKSISSGADKLVVVPNLADHTIDAYMIGANGEWTKSANINQKTDGDGVSLRGQNEIELITGDGGRFMVVWRERVTNSDGSRTVTYKSSVAHKMTDPNTNMVMWHWSTPSSPSGANVDIVDAPRFVMDDLGMTYAVWAATDSVNSRSRIYANIADADGTWDSSPEMLADYDVSTGNFARQPSIAVNILGDVSIAWDQHMTMNTQSMHHIWVVKKE